MKTKVFFYPETIETVEIQHGKFPKDKDVVRGILFLLTNGIPGSAFYKFAEAIGMSSSVLYSLAKSYQAAKGEPKC